MARDFNRICVVKKYSCSAIWSTYVMNDENAWQQCCMLLGVGVGGRGEGGVDCASCRGILFPLKGP